MAADLAALMTRIRGSERWPLVDRLAASLTGQALEERLSSTWSAVTDLPDDELAEILAGVLERTAGYLGLAAPAPAELSDAERAAYAHLADLARDRFGPTELPWFLRALLPHR